MATFERATAIAAVLWIAVACSAEAPRQGPLPGPDFPPAAGGAGGCDLDGDGVERPGCGGADCDDDRAAAHPGAEEACANGLDDDCDGVADEGCGCSPGDLEACWEGEEEARGVGVCRDGARRCGPDGTWGPCLHAVVPEAEAPACDGIDSSCDGVADPDASCGGCPPAAEEICGNGLDDDCDGAIDPADLCTVSCDGVNPRSDDPGELACCLRQPPAIHEFTCHEGGGLPACVDRECLELDGSLDTRCSKLCDRDGCVCGRRQPSGDLTAVADCGFLSPCARIDCADRRNQPCYSGPPATLGVGICRAGTHSCVDQGGHRAWNGCSGEVTPGTEACGNGADEDCDGLIDEEDGATGRRCPAGRICPGGAEEMCGNGLDDDCDGFSDEGCAAGAPRQACWTGSLDARGVGPCQDGFQAADGTTWGICQDEVLPAPEKCGDGIDSDCNGLGGPGEPDEPACCIPGEELCNGLDDDCDGMTDEELLDRCGQCPGAGSCFGISFDDVGDCARPGRSCIGVESSPLDPTLITLPPGAGVAGHQFLYASRTTTEPPDEQVLQVDPATGLPGWSFGTGTGFIRAIEASSDGTVWALKLTTLYHLSAEGDVLCRFDSSESMIHVVVDPGGDLWVLWGRFPSYKVRRLSATDVEREAAPGLPWPDGIPRCAIVDASPDPAETDLAVPSTGPMLVDARLRLWVFASSLLVLEDGSMTNLGPSASTFYGAPTLAPDGSILAGVPLRIIDPDALRAGEADAVRELGSYGYDVRAQQPLPDGTVVAMHYHSGGMPAILHIDPEDGTELARYPTPPSDVQYVTDSVVVDQAGMVWTGLGSKLFRLDLATGTWDAFPLAAKDLVLFRHSAGGSGLAPSHGTWAQVIDPGAWNVAWGTITWEAFAGRGDRVRVRVQFADSLEAIEESPIVCGPFDGSPADLSACGMGRRYARVEIHLSGLGRPVAGNVALTWDRP